MLKTGMETRGARIAFLRKDVLQMTQQQLADALAVKRAAVTNWEDNQGISRENARRLADIAGTTMDWIENGLGSRPKVSERAALSRVLQDPVESFRQSLDRFSRRDADLRSEDVLHVPGEADVRSEDVSHSIEMPPKRTVKVRGYVGASAKMQFYAVADEELEEVERPDGMTDQTIAVEIRGKSLGPLLDTWLVFYDDVRSPVTDDLIGRVCVVGLADDRIVVKKIVRNGRGGFNLESNARREDDIPDAVIEWAAKVKDIRPRG